MLRSDMLKAIVGVLVLAECCWKCGGDQPILPQFNCKKIAFYKTHKTGSTTLGGVMFRVAVGNNMSMYTTSRSHYITVGKKESEHLLGKMDMVLRHIRYSKSSSFHSTTRSFYSRALGTANYGFLTVLRHPVDRYISDFYYYAEPDARKARHPITLEQYANKGSGANRMAHEFAVYTVEGAIEFAMSEMHTDGLYVPMEYMDYGLALLATHCGWSLSRVLYLPVNSNGEGVLRYGNVTLLSRPKLETLAAKEPELLARIASINSVDAILYAAAQNRLLGRLAINGPAVAAGVMATAVRLTAARKRLEVECRAVSSGNYNPVDNGASTEDLASLCAYFTLTDSAYEKMASYKTGFVGSESLVREPVPLPSEGSSPSAWPVSHILRTAEQHLAQYDDTSVAYYHSALAVYVYPPTPAEAKMFYGGVAGDADPLVLLAASVRLWTLHHAREGLHHLVLLVNALNGEQQDVVQLAAAEALGQGAGTYTTFETARCDTAPSDPAASTSDNSSCGVPFDDLAARSRWSALLPNQTFFLHGNRGTVRSVLLLYEGLLQSAGAVCAPLVPWRAAPAGAGLQAGAAPDGGSCVRTPCSLGLKGSFSCVMLRSMPALGRTRTYMSSGSLMPDGKTSYKGPEQHRLEVLQLQPPSQGDLDHWQDSSAPFKCSRLPRPLLQVPWCE